MLLPQNKTSEHRQDKRHPFHWPVAIVFDSHDDRQTFHGITHEVSLSGCSVLTEHNIFSEHPISILLSAPAEHPGASRRVLEIKARMVYTVLASGHRKFRCGVQFLKFKHDARAKLTRVIEHRALRYELG